MKTTPPPAQDNNPEDHSAERLLKILDKFRGWVALVLVILLTVAYFVAAYFNKDKPDQPLATKTVALSYFQDVIANTVPVFVLFVFSYWLFREIDEFRRRRESSLLAGSVADAVRQELDARPTADRFFSKRSSENVLIEQAERELMMVQETGSLIFEQCKDSLTHLLKRGGRIRLITVDSSPRSTGLLAYRNANLLRDGISKRASQLIDHLQDLLHACPGLEQNIEVRFCPYPVCSTTVIADREHNRTDKAKALVRLAGFRIPYNEKLDFHLSLNETPVTFLHYVKEFENLWKASSKIIFLTGEPRCGKTTLLAKLQHDISNLGSTYFCITRDTKDKDGNRTGFEAVTSADANPRQIATRDESGNYKPNIAVIDAIAAEIEAASKKCRLLIIDEIGPIQLQSAAFAKVMKQLIDVPSASVIAAVALDDSKHPLLKEFKAHFRPCLVRLEKGKNDQSILEQIRGEAESFLRRPAFHE